MSEASSGKKRSEAAVTPAFLLALCSIIRFAARLQRRIFLSLSAATRAYEVVAIAAGGSRARASSSKK